MRMLFTSVTKLYTKGLGTKRQKLEKNVVQHKRVHSRGCNPLTPEASQVTLKHEGFDHLTPNY